MDYLKYQKTEIIIKINPTICLSAIASFKNIYANNKLKTIFSDIFRG